MPIPPWLAATSGSAGQAGQVNQFLGAHAVTYLYAGALAASQTTLGSGSVNSNSLWIAQSFTTAVSQTAVGYVMIAAGVTGSPAPWTVSLQAGSSGAPSGTPLVSASFPKEFANASLNFRTVLLPVTGLTPGTQYWIVAAGGGDPSDYYTWNKSNQVSGASTSPDGVTWTAQSYGLLYQVYDTTPVLPLTGTWEDSGARWTSYTYTSGQLTGLEEYTAGQTAGGYTASKRALSYSGGLLTGVA